MNAQELIQQVQLSAKHNNIVRKAAVQSLQPVIKKVEQHIEYLLNQTTKLRLKCQTLQKTTYQHQVINKSVEQLREQVHKFHLDFIQHNTKAQQQSITFKQQIVQLTVQAQKIRADLTKKQTKINDLFQKNTQQVNKLDKTSDSFRQIVEQYVKNITKVEIDNKKLSKQLQKLQDKVNSSLQLLQVQNKWRDTKIQQSNQRLTLYLTERRQLNTLVKDMWTKADKAIDVDRYENDWRIIRMQNQQMKKQNKKMIDQALTPQVRAFLPQMLQRIAQIRKVNSLQISFNQQKLKTDQFQIIQLAQIQSLKNKLAEAEKRTQEVRQQLRNEDEINAQDIKKKLQKRANQIIDEIQKLRGESTNLVIKIQKQIRNDIQYLRQTLIQNNKLKIYEIVQNLIPQEQKQQYNNLKKFSKEVLPIVQNTKMQIMHRCDQITKFGLSLEQRLQSFNNRITKIRGDMNLQIENMKKRIKILQNADTDFIQNLKSLGKIISSYCELFLIIYSLSFDPLDKESYITFHDGMILQKSDNDKQIHYRKLKASKSQMRKAGLASIIKIVDSLLQNQQYLFMQIDQFKPSEYFKAIKQNILMGKLYQTSKKKQIRSNSRVKARQSQYKLPSIQNNLNRTLELGRQESEQDSKKVLSQTIASDFSNMRKKSKQLTKKERYNQIK